VLVVTGGVGLDNIGDWLSAGADGVGIGSSLYKPGKPVKEVAEDAMRFAEAAAAAHSA
jgi:2-dehydro-3-deoxyphosphogalactonate aldolase